MKENRIYARKACAEMEIRMKHGLDVRYINPFVQASTGILENVVQMKLTLGRPGISLLDFADDIFLLQVGIVGELKGQVIIAMSVETAKMIASTMMCGMPVEELDEMPRSALSELSNMIMGNAATLFSSQEILIDITTPMSMLGSHLSLQTEVEALKVPLLQDGEGVIDLYICVSGD